MKTIRVTKYITFTHTPTKELLKEALTSYRPTGFKDFVVFVFAHSAAESFLKRGSLNEPGEWAIDLEFFSKKRPWYLYNQSLRKLP